jgi:hypothetical protein
MRKSIFSLALLLGGILLPLLGPASAADLNAGMRGPRIAGLPFPRSERAASVWAGDACWRDCGSHCAWGMASCLSRDAQGKCVGLVDTCDRYCQRECRTSGGPLLPIDF